MTITVNNGPRIYSVVIMTASVGIVSRAIGSDYDQARALAKLRREDFPDAKEIRVVCPEDGVLFVC